VKNANVFQNGNNAWERDVKWTERLRERESGEWMIGRAVRGAGNGVLAHLRPLGLLIRERARKHIIYMCVCVGSSIGSTCAKLMIGCRWSCIGNVFAFPVVRINIIYIYIYYYMPPENSTDSQRAFTVRAVRLYFYF